MTGFRGSDGDNGAGASQTPGAGRSLTQFLTYRILRLHLAFNAQTIATLDKVCDLGIGQWRVLAMIGAREAQTSRDLARKTKMDPAFVSRTLQSLESEGLVSTKRSASDRRLLELALTIKGAEIYGRTFPVMQRRQERLLDCISKTEREAIFRIIDKLDVAAEVRDFGP